MVRRAAFVVLALVLAACSGGGGGLDGGDSAVEASLEIGTGLMAFEPLASSGGELELVYGPQGGWHLHGSMRVRGIDPTQLFWRVVSVEDGRVLSEYALDVRRGTFVRVGDADERVGDQLVLDIAAPSEVVGREVRVEGSVRDGTGRTLAANVVGRVIDREP